MDDMLWACCAECRMAVIDTSAIPIHTHTAEGYFIGNHQRRTDAQTTRPNDRAIETAETGRDRVERRVLHDTRIQYYAHS